VTDAIDTTIESGQPPMLVGSGANAAAADRLLRGLAATGGLLIWLMLATVFAALLVGAWPSIHAFGLQFLLRPGAPGLPHWPREGFGAARAIGATMASSCLALVLALPPSVATAIFLTRVASGRLEHAARVLVRAMAAIPSVAYGFWGAAVAVPWLGRWTSNFTDQRVMPSGDSLFAAGIVLAVMIAPLITAVSVDVLKRCPPGQIDGAVALGATWWQSVWGMLGRCRRGLVAAALLGLGRAIGETIVVAMVFSALISPTASANALPGGAIESTQPIASLLAVRFAEAPQGIERASMIELALLLAVMSLLFILAARRLGASGQTSDVARG
jgi:phosphate transport system permease protein